MVMGAENATLRLLNRTKYLQNRTKYYTVRNTVLSQTERPRFVAGSFYDASNNRRLLSLKKRFLNRRSSRRGPFQMLSLPHEYHKSLGDPLYYSQAELVASCSAASAENMCDPFFWRQICEKIREVRDVMCIHGLLRCVAGVVRVNYYDRDLFRVLSREFVDDVDKLSLEELARLLHCYHRQNVHSCDLVDAVGSRVASKLLKELEEGLVEPPEPEARGVIGKIKDIMPGTEPTTTQPNLINVRPLALTLKYLCYFKYANSHFYLSVANLFVKHSHRMDTRSRLELFTYLDPKLMFPDPMASPSSESNSEAVAAPAFESNVDADGASASESGTSNQSQLLNNQSTELVHKLLDSLSANIGPEGLYHENGYEFGVFLSSELFREPANSKLVHELCSVCSSSKLVASAINRYVSNCVYLGCGWRDSLNSLISMLSSLSAELAPILSKLSALGPASTAVKSPFIGSLENIAMDSMLTSIRSLNGCWRLKLGCVDVADPVNRCRLLTFSLEDDNVHSTFLREFHALALGTADLELLSRVSEAINSFGCPAQSVHNLTCCFESFTALLNKPGALSQRLKRDLSAATGAISTEIIRQLVEFDRESLYRVSLSLSSSASTTATSTDTNTQLQHYVKYFPKITRRSHQRHHITLSNPFNDVT